MRWKGERSKQGQSNNKAKQHNTPKAVTFQKKRAASGGTRTHDTLLYNYVLVLLPSMLNTRNSTYVYVFACVCVHISCVQVTCTLTMFPKLCVC